MVHFLFATIFNNKKFLIVVSIVIVALVIDTSLIKIYLISGQSLLSWKIVIFLIIATVYAIGQYFVLEFVKQRSREIRTRKQLHLDTIHKIVTIVQYILTAIIIFIILQILVTSRYNTFIIATSTIMSYIVAITMLGLLAQRFYSWFKSNRNSVVILYGLSSTMLAINAIFVLIFVGIMSFSWPKEIYPFFVGGAFLASGSVIYVLNQIHFISSIVAFTITWLATTLLLRHYIQRVGRLKYWIILGIPLAFFLSQFVSLSLNLFAPLLKYDPVLFGIVLTLIFTLSKPVGGILFGIAFWTIAKNISQGSVVRDYILISAYGFILLFISEQGIILSLVAYPPFGLITISFMGLSCYLILVGIYSSAISISEDMRLRRSIRKYAIKESKLLDSIGTAQVEQEIQRRVITMTREHEDIIKEETGLQLVDQDDIKQYVDEVLKTIKSNRKERT